jgi:hypothetical protein
VSQTWFFTIREKQNNWASSVNAEIQIVWKSNKGPRDVRNQRKVAFFKSRMRIKSDKRRNNTNEFLHKINIFTIVNSVGKIRHDETE